MSFLKRAIKIDDLAAVALPISNLIKQGDVVVLKGDIGAGKTTLVTQIAKNIGIVESVTSPTFAIVNTYDIENPQSDLHRLIHIDTYRLDHVNELYDLGIETLFDDSSVTFIEWGEKIQDYIDQNHFVIEIDESNPDSRDFLFNINGELDPNRRAQIEMELLANGWESND